MNSDNRATAPPGFVAAPDQGKAFWFLNTLTISKAGSDDTQRRLSIVDHRVPPGFAPPPHIHQHSDEAFLILDGDFDRFAGTRPGRPGRAAWCSSTRHPARLHRLPSRPGRAIIVLSPGGFDHFVAALASRPGSFGCLSRTSPIRPASPSSPPLTASRSSPSPAPATNGPARARSSAIRQPRMTRPNPAAPGNTPKPGRRRLIKAKQLP
jgi:hypothetical protein